MKTLGLSRIALGIALGTLILLVVCWTHQAAFFSPPPSELRQDIAPIEYSFPTPLSSYSVYNYPLFADNTHGCIGRDSLDWNVRNKHWRWSPSTYDLEKILQGSSAPDRQRKILADLSGQAVEENASIWTRFSIALEQAGRGFYPDALVTLSRIEPKLDEELLSESVTTHVLQTYPGLSMTQILQQQRHTEHNPAAEEFVRKDRILRWIVYRRLQYRDSVGAAVSALYIQSLPERNDALLEVLRAQIYQLGRDRFEKTDGKMWPKIERTLEYLTPDARDYGYGIIAADRFQAKDFAAAWNRIDQIRDLDVRDKALTWITLGNGEGSTIPFYTTESEIRRQFESRFHGVLPLAQYRVCMEKRDKSNRKIDQNALMEQIEPIREEVLKQPFSVAKRDFILYKLPAKDSQARRETLLSLFDDIRKLDAKHPLAVSSCLELLGDYQQYVFNKNYYASSRSAKKEEKMSEYVLTRTDIDSICEWLLKAALEKYAGTESMKPYDLHMPRKYVYKSARSFGGFELACVLRTLVVCDLPQAVDAVCALNIPRCYDSYFIEQIKNASRARWGESFDAGLRSFLERAKPETYYFFMSSEMNRYLYERAMRIYEQEQRSKDTNANLK